MALLFLTCLGLCLWGRWPKGAAQEFDIWIAVSGNAGAEDDLNPAAVVYKKWPQHGSRVLGFINYRRPRNSEEIRSGVGLPPAEADDILSSLENCGLVQYDPENGYRVTFAVFDDDVWAQFKPIITKVATTIQEKAIDTLLPQLKTTYQKSGFPRFEIPLLVIAPIVIGAFGLDESAIDELQRHDLIRVTKKQPGDRNYVVLSGEAGTTTKFPLYGIHASSWDAVYYGTFGENQVMNRRRAELRTLPDIIWNWPGRGFQKIDKEGFIRSLSRLVREYGNAEFSLAGLRKMFPNDSGYPLFQLWTELGLIELKSTDLYRIRFPVFAPQEIERFQEVAKATGAAVLKIMKSFYPDFGQAYLGTNPSANGVPLPEVLNLVYHHTYSLALVEIMAREPEFGFLYEDGELRYTGYARLQR